MAPTGNERGVKRTEIITPLVTDDGRLVFDRDRAHEHLADIVSTLLTVGGSVRIVADRVLVGKLPEDAQGFREPVGETVGLVVEYGSQAPLHRESLTLHMLRAMGDDGDAPPPALAAEMTAGLEDDGAQDHHDGVEEG